jgi:hypothetical protein
MGNVKELQEIFYKYLGCHFVEQVGGIITFTGFIYEMEFAHNGLRRRTSFDDIYNAVKVIYNGGASSTAWNENTESIARWGRKEKIIDLPDVTTPATAIAQRDAQLRKSGWQQITPMSISKERSGASLHVMVAGYVFTANWRYTSITLGAPTALSTVLTSIINADCPFLSVGDIEANSTIIDAVDNTKTAWQQIIDLLEFGSSTQQPVRFFVGSNRGAFYATINKEPQLFLRGGGIYAQMGAQAEILPRYVQPSVLRDLLYTVPVNQPDSFLLDFRDMLIDEVSVSADGELGLNVLDIDDADVMAYLPERSAQN